MSSFFHEIFIHELVMQSVDSPQVCVLASFWNIRF